jgi:RNA polymerase sigma-70 factor (ECF subfamily)
VPTGSVPEQPTDDDPADAAMTTASTAHALELIRRLPPDQAEAIALRVIADLDVARVAELMQREPGSVRVLTFRGLRRLAAQNASLQLTNNSTDGVTP